MNDPRLNYANEYPVEILPPDRSGYKKTNTGVDYILTLSIFLSLKILYGQTNL